MKLQYSKVYEKGSRTHIYSYILVNATHSLHSTTQCYYGVKSMCIISELQLSMTSIHGSKMGYTTGESTLLWSAVYRSLFWNHKWCSAPSGGAAMRRIAQVAQVEVGVWGHSPVTVAVTATALVDMVNQVNQIEEINVSNTLEFLLKRQLWILRPTIEVVQKIHIHVH